MSQPFNQLTDAERFAYLQAMEVVQWVPRDQEFPVDSDVAEAPPVARVSRDIEKESSSDSSEQVAVQPTYTESPIPTDPIAPLQSDQQPDQGSDEQPSIEQNLDSQPAATEPSHADIAQQQERIETQDIAEANQPESTESPEKHFVKMVNWRSNDQADNKLLILCRHQTDQPAQSFARSNGPSQFMQDYIQALNGLCQSNEYPLQVRMGHLSQAGLGDGCVGLEKSLGQLKPQLALVLGDETVRELFGEESDVTSLRGKLLELPNGDKAIVSYHPFTLIKNPQLKALALEDHKMLVRYLTQQA